jgi:short-subunit dehydrogenase
VSTYLVDRRLKPIQVRAVRVRARGWEAPCYPADLAKQSSRSNLSRRHRWDLSHVDVLVQHASGSARSAGRWDFESHYCTSPRAAYASTYAFLQALKAWRGDGRRRA